MNYTTLQTAVDATKMLLLLGNGSKTFNGLHQVKAYEAIVTRLRANIDTSVYTMVRGNDKAQKMAFELYIQNVHAALVKAMPMINVANVVKNLEGHTLLSCLVTPKMATSPALQNEAKTFLSAIAFPENEVFHDTAQNRNVLRGQILRKFNSVVRNDSWHMLLLTLGTGNALALNQQLEGFYGSDQGRIQRDGKFASLITDGSTAPNKASTDTNDMLVTIEISEKSISMHPEVAPLIAAMLLDAASMRVMDALVKEAMKKVDVYVFHVGAAIEEKIATLVVGLENQKKVSSLAQEKKNRDALQKKEEHLVKTLASMGDELQMMLKNPDILARAMAEVEAAKSLKALKKTAAKRGR